MVINKLPSWINIKLSRLISNYRSILIINEKYKYQKLLKKRVVYDCIIIVFVLEETEDIQKLFEFLYKALSPNGRVFILYQNYLQSFFSELIFKILNSETKPKNWLSTTDIINFLDLTNFEIITKQPLWFTHARLPLSFILNKIILYFFPFNHLARYHYVVARKSQIKSKNASLSIIIPTRNEAGTIETIFKKFPNFETKTEVIFVEGNSKDNTREIILKCIKKYKNILPYSVKLIDQGFGKGKADAVKKGIANAKNQIICIFDADISMKIEDIHKFYQAIITGKGDFINGSRLVYPIPQQAMQKLNILGNKFFSIFFTWLLGQAIKDTLCGTKVFWRQDYLKMINYDYYGKYDPFGDFDLLFSASQMNLKIIDLPIRYYERRYGSTNITRFRNALELLRFSCIATYKYKFRFI